MLRGGDIKKDIHYKGDVGQSIIPNKSAAATFNSQTPFFQHLISLNLSFSQPNDKEKRSPKIQSWLSYMKQKGHFFRQKLY